jgi:hypothetical protein
LRLLDQRIYFIYRAPPHSSLSSMLHLTFTGTVVQLHDRCQSYGIEALFAIQYIGCGDRGGVVTQIMMSWTSKGVGK